jgi:hypothetical protein
MKNRKRCFLPPMDFLSRPFSAIDSLLRASASLPMRCDICYTLSNFFPLISIHSLCYCFPLL